METIRAALDLKASDRAPLDRGLVGPLPTKPCRTAPALLLALRVQQQDDKCLRQQIRAIRRRRLRAPAARLLAPLTPRPFPPPLPQDRIAAHSGDADHHARESNEVGTIAELTDVAAEFSDSPPNRDHLSAALDTKVNRAARDGALRAGYALSSACGPMSMSAAAERPACSLDRRVQRRSLLRARLTLRQALPYALCISRHLSAGPAGGARSEAADGGGGVAGGAGGGHRPGAQLLNTQHPLGQLKALQPVPALAAAHVRPQPKTVEASARLNSRNTAARRAAACALPASRGQPAAA